MYDDNSEILERISDQLAEGQSHANAMMWSRTLDRMSPACAGIILVFGIFYLPFWIHKKLKERRERAREESGSTQW